MDPKDADLITWIAGLDDADRDRMLAQIDLGPETEPGSPAKLALLDVALALLPPKSGGGPNRVQ